MNMRSLFTLILFSALANLTYGQVVTGRVTEASGDPLPGVSVVIAGTSQGTVTDAGGVYKLEVVPNTTLRFSFVGYKNYSIEVGSKTSIDIVMEPDIQQLNEIIVVGYGSMRKSDITGSIVSVTADEAVARQYNTVDQMLKGRAAGVQVISNPGNPGMGISVRIRGTNSLRGNNEPLYVIDGVLITSAAQDAASGSTDGNSLQANQNGLNGLNPRDIESIEVLKDASATAIYGSRGSNGVVLITTKQGVAGQMKVDAYITSSVTEINKKIDVLNGVDYAQYRNESAIMSGNDPNYYINGSNVYPITYPNGSPEIGSEPYQLLNWQDEIYQQALSYNAGAAFSGGSENGTYYISAGYNRLAGIVETSLIQSGDFRVNVTQNVTKNLKVDGRVSAFFSKGSFAQDGSRAGGQRSFIKNVIKYSPIVDSGIDDFADDLGLSNPAAWLQDFEDISREIRFQGSLAITYKLPVKGLRFQVRAGGDSRLKERRRFYGLTTFQGSMDNGRFSSGELLKLSYTVNSLFLYNRSFGPNHQVNGTIGYTFDGDYLENKTYEVTDFATTYFGTDGPEYGALVSGPYKTSPQQQKVNSFILRANYSFMDRYIFTGTFRADGSSKFSPGNKYSYFPSFSFAWRASEEGFVKSVNVFDDLKVRAGWGRTGNQAIGPYNTFGNYDIGYYSQADNSTGIAFVPINIANPDLTWETTTQINAGLDLGFFQSRLIVNADVYAKQTDNLLQQIVLAKSTGYNGMLINRGSIENKGIDLGLSGVILNKNDFYLNIGGNISMNRNKVLNLGIPRSPVYIDGKESIESYYLGDNISTGNYFKSPANIFMDGQPMGMFWGYQTDGIYQSNDSEILAGFQPGDVKIIDQNGDGIIDLNDRTFIGDPNPTFIYGATVTFEWKRLSFNALLTGVYGNQIANGLLLEMHTANGTASNINPATYHDAWRPGAESNSYPRVLYDGNNGASAITDRIIEDGSYFRVGNVTIGYDLPLEKVFNRFYLYVSGQNLLTFTGYSGYEPNITSFLYNGNIQGVDWNGFPNARTYLIGLNFTF